MSLSKVLVGVSPSKFGFKAIELISQLKGYYKQNPFFIELKVVWLIFMPLNWDLKLVYFSFDQLL